MQQNLKSPRKKSPAHLRMPWATNLYIVGAGRLGTALGSALEEAGYRVRLVIAKHLANAQRAARVIGGVAVGISVNHLRRLSSIQAESLAQSSLILITTPDDVIDEVAKQLAAIFKQVKTANSYPSKMVHTVLHTSGALPSTVLQPLKQLGFAIGSLHPLVSISEADSGHSAFRESFFCVEGDKAAVGV